MNLLLPLLGFGVGKKKYDLFRIAIFTIIDNCLKLWDINSTIFWFTWLTRLTLILCLSVNEQWWMGQMAVRCCRSPSRSSIVNKGCREFLLLFQGSLIPTVSLIINAPNASRNDVAGVPISLREVLSILCFKFWPQDEPSPDRPAVIFCQLFSSGEFKVEWWAASWLKFSVHGGRWCKSLDPLSRGFLLHFSTFFQSENPTPRLFFHLIQQVLCKVAQSTLQQPEHTTKQSLLNQRHGSSLAYKW